MHSRACDACVVLQHAQTLHQGPCQSPNGGNCLLLQNLEFILQTSRTSNPAKHASQIQEALRELILKRKARNEDVFEWIDVSNRKFYQQEFCYCE